MIGLNFQQLDEETMVALYSIDFDSGTSLQSMLNDIQEKRMNIPGIVTIEIVKVKYLELQMRDSKHQILHLVILLWVI